MIYINDRPVQAGQFPDKTLALKLNPAGDCDRHMTKITWKYENDGELFQLICIKRHLEEAGFDMTSVDLHLPYLPHARMDRVKNPEDVFTLKYFCEVINSLNFSKVFVHDVHSNVGLALLDRVVDCYEGLNQLKAIEDIRLSDNVYITALFYPDEGAMKRYTVPKKNELVAFGVKKRNWETGKIEQLSIVGAENVKDRDILIIDDICSYGGTFVRAARALKEAGANKIYLYVTHCEENIFKGEVFSSGLIERVYTTDSIFKPEWTNDKILIVNN